MPNASPSAVLIFVGALFLIPIAAISTLIGVGAGHSNVLTPMLTALVGGAITTATTLISPYALTRTSPPAPPVPPPAPVEVSPADRPAMP